MARLWRSASTLWNFGQEINPDTNVMATTHHHERAKSLHRSVSWAENLGEEENSKPPTGMYPTKRSWSLPNVKQHLRRIGVQDLETLPENQDNITRQTPEEIMVRGKLYLPSRVKSVPCELSWCKTQASAVIGVHVGGKCVLELDRRLLQFRENLERRELAFNAKEGYGEERYEWWSVKVNREDRLGFLRLHREIAEDASW